MFGEVRRQNLEKLQQNIRNRTSDGKKKPQVVHLRRSSISLDLFSHCRHGSQTRCSTAFSFLNRPRRIRGRIVRRRRRRIMRRVMLPTRGRLCRKLGWSCEKSLGMAVAGGEISCWPPSQPCSGSSSLQLSSLLASASASEVKWRFLNQCSVSLGE